LSDDNAGLAAAFRHFADVECRRDPLYVAICRAVAEAPGLLALMAHAPATQRKPNLLLAALHERVLAGVGHPLRDYYPSVGGTRLPDDRLAAALLDFAALERPRLIELLRLRSTQTNEIGRCAVLWPALQRIAALTGRQDLALLDFGSSAGLNLGVDGYHYDYGDFALGAPVAAGRPAIRCDWLGSAAPPPAFDWRLVHRLGLDPAAIDVHDEDAVRWLRACLWPHDRARAERLEQAVALARRAGWRVEQADDGLARIEPWLDALPDGVQPVLFNSWVLHYFDAPALQRHRERVEQLIATRGLAWLSAEAPTLGPPGLTPPRLIDGAEDAGSATLWSLQWNGGRAALAWSHPHGRWVQWLA
jgi:hypothetical protein